MEPLSAPIDGGTLITVMGQNLGIVISDVLSVKLGEIECDIVEDLYRVSTR